MERLTSIEQRVREQADEISRESMYVIREYGVSAWYDIGAFTSYSVARGSIDQMIEYHERQELYEDCIFLVDVKKLFND